MTVLEAVLRANPLSMPRFKAAQPPQADAVALLRELVACETLAGRIENADHPMPREVKEYHERRAIVMANARAFLAKTGGQG